MGDDLLLLPVVVVLEGLGVLVPEVVVDDHVQPLGVEVHVLLGVRLVGHLGRGGLQWKQLGYRRNGGSCLDLP